MPFQCPRMATPATSPMASSVLTLTGIPFTSIFPCPIRPPGRFSNWRNGRTTLKAELDSGKKNLASTGAKTLTYKDAERNTTATYNYSPVAAVQQLTELFQNLSTTLEFGRRLQYFHRYQKLALDEELKRLEESANQDNLTEMPALVPILQLIANDQSVINPVRARALRIIERAGTVKR